LPPGWNFERDAGVGLRNVSARLGHLYGRPGLIRLEPRTSGGLDVEIDVPDRPVTGQANAGDAVEGR
jgi:sensor histidine kinase YesM